MTITEKIISKACGKDVKPGEIVNAKIDKLMIVEIAGPIVFGHFEKFGTTKLYDPDMLVLMTDHFGLGHNVKDSNHISNFRNYAKKYHLKNFYDFGRNGICHQVMTENGWVLPGTLTVGTDSHATTYGAMGAFGCGVSPTEAAVIMATGYVWFRVPNSIKIVLKGKLPFGCYGKDIALKIINILGCDEIALYKALEITGEGVKSLNIDDRLAICNMMAETGAKNSIIAADEITSAYLKERTNKPFDMVQSDSDASYDEEIEFNLDDLVPLVAIPHLTSDIKPAGEVKDVAINTVFLGSCTSGRLSEIAIAAKILKGKKLPDDVRMIVVPSSQKIYLECVKLGYVETLVEAGAVFETSSCACCGGFHTGVLPFDAVCVSTTNRNFQGRMGSPGAFIYLASAATAVASALEGHIVDPRKYLNEGGLTK